MTRRRLSRRRFGTLASGAVLGSGCARRRNGELYASPPGVIWVPTMDRVGPIRKARAAVSRRRGDRSKVDPPEALGQIRELQRYEQLNISGIHAFGDGVSAVVGTQLRLVLSDFSGDRTIADVSSPIVVSSGNRALVSLRDGSLAIYRTADGKRRGEVAPRHRYPLVGVLFRPPFVVFALAGKIDIDERRGYETGILELSRIFDIRGGEDAVVSRARPARMLFWQLRGLALSSRGGTVVAASSSGFTWFDWSLQINRTRPLPTGKRTVRAVDVAVGPGDSVHGLFRRGSGPELVMCPTPNSELITLHPDIPLPPESARDSVWSPLPGPDGRVALAPPGQIMCFDADGNLAWQFKRNGTAPALVVKGGILVEHGSALFVLDWAGKFRHVWTAPAPITARPLFHEKHWYVASEVGLHRLKG